jgi:Tetratricopeptide repeat
MSKPPLALVRQALGDAQRLPLADQDQTLLASLLQNDALVSEATGDWPTALGRQQQALAIRREAEDARGAAQSLHGIGKAYCGLGRPGDAEQALEEAAQAADSLGEHLLRAKITHALADVRITQHRLDDAAQLTTQALAGFERHGTPYDVAAAQLTLARIAGQQGNRAEAVTHADRARSAIEPGGYRVLYRLFPDQAVPPAARIRAGLLTFAAGDALGVPWEGCPQGEIDPSQVTGIRPPGGGYPADRGHPWGHRSSRSSVCGRSNGFLCAGRLPGSRSDNGRIGGVRPHGPGRTPPLPFGCKICEPPRTGRGGLARAG